MPRRRFCKKCGHPLSVRTVAQVRQQLAHALELYDEPWGEAEEGARYQDVTGRIRGQTLAARVRKIAAQLSGECGGGEFCEKDAAKKEADDAAA